MVRPFAPVWWYILFTVHPLVALDTIPLQRYDGVNVDDTIIKLPWWHPDVRTYVRNTEILGDDDPKLPYVLRKNMTRQRMSGPRHDWPHAPCDSTLRVELKLITCLIWVGGMYADVSTSLVHGPADMQICTSRRTARAIPYLILSVYCVRSELGNGFEGSFGTQEFDKIPLNFGFVHIRFDNFRSLKQSIFSLFATL